MRPASALLFPLAAMAVFVPHAPLFHLPYFWDEIGYYIPAALDFFERGLLVPRSTPPNVHPPGLTLWLALVWRTAGCSIAATRCGMLLLASGAVVVVYLLARELTRSASRAAAPLAVLFLLLSPLFFTQAMLAQIDLPALLLFSLALLLFLKERIRAAALACGALVLVRETGVVAPLVFALWLAAERRRREALLFLVPAALLGAWLAGLHLATREWFGDDEFTRFNVLFPLHPVRLPAALARRISFLLIENFHWVGTAAIGWAVARTRLFDTRAWRVTLVTAAAMALAVTVFGGAALERYLLPVLPVFYIAAAAALATRGRVWAAAGAPLLAAGLLVSHFAGPPLLPAPFENNLAMVDLVRLHQSAAAYLDRQHRGGAIVTAWPLSDALRRPEFGYVTRRLPVKGLPDFSPSSLARVEAAGAEWFVLYSRDREPPLSLSRLRWARALRRAYWNWEPPVSGSDLETRLNLRRVARWERGGLWAEVYRPLSGRVTILKPDSESVTR